MKNRIIHIILLLILVRNTIQLVQAQKSAASIRIQQMEQERWVDSVYTSLTLDHQLGQLFMVAAFSNRDESHNQSIDRLIKSYNIGGLIFFQGGPVRQAILTNRYQKKSRVPLLLAMDAEWGLGMRLDSTMNFPKQMTLGAIQDNSLVYDMGKEIARQCRRIGMQINFAPVVDVNVNPNNPVIGYRSFGENKYLVAEKGKAYMKGLQHGRVMANAKHFPGHGDTDKDSHYDLPLIKHSKERLDSIELYPFKELIKDSLMSIMVAHLNIPSLDNSRNKPSTLSSKVVTDLLRKDLGFKGLIFTDAMNMHGVTKHYRAGQANSKALEAGNDILLFPSEVRKAIESLKKSLEKNRLSKEDIKNRVKKVLRSKYWAGLHKTKFVETQNLYENLNKAKSKMLNRKLYAKAITTVKNKDDFLPIQVLDTNTFAVVSIGEKIGNTFQKGLKKYADFDFFSLDKNASNHESLIKKLSKYKVVVVGFHHMSNRPSRNFGIKQSYLDFLARLNKETLTVSCLFGNAYALKYFPKEDYLVCAYEENEHTLSLVPQILFGGMDCSGKLPITPHKSIPYGSGYQLKSLGRLSYGLPEDLGLDSKKLTPIDTIVEWAIRDKMTPGCRVLVAKDSKVIFDKSYGHLTYQKKNPVQQETVYDLASITKVLGTLQAVMFLCEQKKINLDHSLSSCLKEAKHTNKSKLVIKNMLTHQSGLQPYIPFWFQTIISDSAKELYYRSNYSEDNSIRISNNMYMRSEIEDSLIKWTLETDLLNKNRKNKKYPYPYKYSDMGYHMLKRILERKLNQPIHKFLKHEFYNSLGMSSTNYLPLKNGIDTEKIAPTEIDTLYRKGEVRGTVHDQVAAMIGGVGGHAGLFSNADDLAKILQMLLNKGQYAGKQYFAKETVELFTKKQNKYSRRGIGWDKVQEDGLGPSSEMSSLQSFGHSGFTGTLVWVDPDYNLIYVFLSNRTYPSSSNNLLLKNDIRTRIQDVAYEAIMMESH